MNDKVMQDVIIKRAVNDIIKSFNLYKIDYLTLPREMQRAIIDAYISGATAFYELTRVKVKKYE